jgi:hypothetical protein
MNVQQLKEILADVPDDYLVVMSSDTEGNNYSPLSGWAIGEYVADTTWSGEVYFDNKDEDDDIGEGEDWVEAQFALVLWPVN